MIRSATLYRKVYKNDSAQFKRRQRWFQQFVFVSKWLNDNTINKIRFLYTGYRCSHRTRFKWQNKLWGKQRIAEDGAKPESSRRFWNFNKKRGKFQVCLGKTPAAASLYPASSLPPFFNVPVDLLDRLVPRAVRPYEIAFFF